MKIEDGSAFKEWQRWQDACQRVQLLTARRTAPPRWQRVWNHLRQIRIRIHWKFTWTLLAAVALFLAAEWVMMQRYQPVERGVVFDRLANRYCGFDPMYLRWGCTPSLNQGGTNAR